MSALLAVISGICSLAPYVAVYLVTVTLFDPASVGASTGASSVTGAGTNAVSAAIGHIAAWTAVAIVVRAVTAGLSTYVGHVASYRILADLRRAIARTLQRIPLGRVQARSSGEIKKLLHDDVEQMEEALAHGVPDMAAAAAVPVATTILLFVLDWKLALVALGALVLLIVVSGIGMRLAMPSDKLLAEHTNVLNKAVLGYLQGIKVIRGFLRPDSGYDQARDAIVEGGRLEAQVTSGPLRWLVATMSAATGFAVAVLIPVAGHGFANGTVSLSTLALFLLISLAYLNPIISLVGTIATIMARIQFAAGSIRDILNEQTLPEPTNPRVPTRFDLHFNQVTFAYTPDAAPVLSNFNLSIPQGSRVALVGPTGAGKTTIARLAARFWDVSAGTVQIGGITVQDIPQTDLARLIAFVQQDEYLFAASLRENIRIARPGASDADVEQAGQAAQLADLVAELPQGWDTPLPPGGGTLSGGQRQRVSIARALLKDAPIVILDEATASLDTQTEQATLAAINELTASRTVIAIAHRLETIREADQVVLIEHGSVSAQGTFDQMVAESPGFGQLWLAYTQARGWHLNRGGNAQLAPVPEPSLISNTRTTPTIQTAANPVPSVNSANTAHTQQDQQKKNTPNDSDHPQPEAIARSVVTPGIGSMRFSKQWVRLFGHGWKKLLREAVPKMFVEGLVRGIPLLAVFLVLNAAIAATSTGSTLDAQFVWLVSGIVAAGLLARLLAAQWVNQSVWSIAAQSKADLQLSIVERLRRVPLGFFSRIDNGRVTTLIGNDIVMIDFQNVPQQVAAALIQPIYVTVVLLIVDWRLALAALIGLPLFWLITTLSDRIYHRVFADVHAARLEATTILIEQAKGAAVLRGNTSSFIATRFEQAVTRLQRTSQAMSVRALPTIALGSIAIELGLVVLIAIGGALFSAGAVGATTLLLFLLLALSLYQPIQELNALVGYRHNQQQIALKIAEVWDAPVLSEPESPARPGDASIEFDNVTFAYDAEPDVGGSGEPTAESGVGRNAGPVARASAESNAGASAGPDAGPGGGLVNGRKVLDGVTFRAEPGTITALVGPSGAGKTTIANLTARLWDADAGTIRIGGKDVRELGSAAVMQMVTTVYQDVYLFNDTIRYNVTMGRPGATDAEIWDALAAAQVDDVVRALPAGLDTVIDEGGANLSGGQRQRLSIARALLKDSPILILDEAVASVDPDTEARIQDAIGRLAAGRTVLVIAHRLETIRNVDQVLLVKEGSVRALYPVSRG